MDINKSDINTRGDFLKISYSGIYENMTYNISTFFFSVLRLTTTSSLVLLRNQWTLQKILFVEKWYQQEIYLIIVNCSLPLTKSCIQLFTSCISYAVTGLKCYFFCVYNIVSLPLTLTGNIYLSFPVFSSLCPVTQIIMDHE